MKKKLGLYILSYKRLDLLIEMIESLQNQTVKDFDVIISENSNDYTIYNDLKKKYLNQNILLLKHFLSPIEHLNEVKKIAEIYYDYYAILHDDDKVDSNFVEDILNQIALEPNFTTLSYNSYIIAEKHLTTNKLNPNLLNSKKITQIDKFVLGYLDKNIGITAFPSYIYNSKFTQNIFFNKNEAGKHSDVTFLIKLLNQKDAYFIQSEKCLYYYRRHEYNDSNSINIKDTYKLSKFILRNSKSLNLKIKTIIFLIKNILKYIIQNTK